MTFFHLHAHSWYSTLDGMPSIPDMVARAVRHGQPALGLTDHGNMSGAVELYAECRGAGIKPFPGSEFYVVNSVLDDKPKRYHLTILAMTNAGFEGLVNLSSMSHDRMRYHYKPRIDLADLAQVASDPDVADGLIVLTGCWFGLLQQTILEASVSGPEAAQAAGESMVNMLAAWFPNLFIEAQNHNVGHQDGMTDADMLDMLDTISEATSVPVVVTQDSHYVNMRDRKAHDMMKRIAYVGDADNSFPGDGYHLSSSEWVREHHTPERWESTLRVCQELVDRNSLVIDELEHYSYHVPLIGKNPQTWLEITTKRAMADLGLDSPEYKRQHRLELDVIDRLGMAGYFRLIYEGVRFAKDEGIHVRARGSASGSLLCFLLGITAVDPVEWGLRFDRFLSLDRKKPPDIDLDIEDTRRDEIVEFYRQQFRVMGIGTYSRLGENEYGQGSVMIQYLSQMRRELGDRFASEMGHVKSIHDIADKRDRALLHRLAEMKVKKAPGAHAAGYVVGTADRPIEKLVPTMLIPSSGSTVTQYTMDDIERLGYIKIDLLGQRTLTTVSRCLELLGKQRDDLTWIPYDDRHTMRELRKGYSDTGIFQLEGWTAAKGCREMKVTKTEDIIRVNALYRPATISSGYKDLYLHNRANKANIEYPPHPAFKKHLASTFGVAIFQEQIMAILRDIGVPYEELNAFLSALKLSNDKAVKARQIFKDHRKRFIDLCVRDWNLSRREAQECWDAISGFAGYGFNRAHASAYGILGYQMAYLKTHYTLEFMAALLETTSGTTKEAAYVKEAKRLGIKLLTADVNYSGVAWRLDTHKGGIRKGLRSIKGVGAKAALEITENGPYDNIVHLIERTDSRAVTGGKSWEKDRTLNGVLEALRRGGALRSLGLDPYM